MSDGHRARSEGYQRFTLAGYNLKSLD